MRKKLRKLLNQLKSTYFLISIIEIRKPGRLFILKKDFILALKATHLVSKGFNLYGDGNIAERILKTIGHIAKIIMAPFSNLEV